MRAWPAGDRRSPLGAAICVSLHLVLGSFHFSFFLLSLSSAVCSASGIPLPQCCGCFRAKIDHVLQKKGRKGFRVCYICWGAFSPYYGSDPPVYTCPPAFNFSDDGQVQAQYPVGVKCTWKCVNWDEEGTATCKYGNGQLEEAYFWEYYTTKDRLGRHWKTDISDFNPPPCSKPPGLGKVGRSDFLCIGRWNARR